MFLRAITMALATLIVEALPAFAADACKSTLECAQAAVTAAAQAEGAVKALESELDQFKAKSHLVCKTVQQQSNRGRFPSIVASLSDQDIKDGYVVTGGGCEQVQPDNNFAFISSRPAGASGWYCQTGDLPGIPGAVQVQATVIGCKLSYQ
jgi:hypothetical protein